MENNSAQNNEKIRVQYRKPSVFSSILLILIGFVLAVIVLSLVYVFVLKEDKTELPNNEQVEENNEEQEENNKNEETPKLDLSVEGDFVKGLYAKIPLQARGYEPYYASVTRFDDISDSKRLLYTLRKLEKEYSYKLIKGAAGLESKLTKLQMMDLDTIEIKKFDFNVVEKEYKSIFGSSKNIPLISTDNTVGYLYEYCTEDSCFYGHPYAGGGGQDFRPYPTIERCEQSEDGKEIYIYDRFIAFDTDEFVPEQVTKYALYDRAWPGSDKNKNDYKIVGGLEYERDTSTNGSLFNGKKIEELLEEYKDKAGKFKHTYKLDDTGNYYWYSSEKI